MIQKQRIGEIEILRGMAFAAVVLQHSIAHYSVVPNLTMESGAQLTLLLIAAKFAVPAFIFITGLVLFYNYDGELAYGSFIRKRFKDIVIPYLLWSVIYMIVAFFKQPSIVQGWLDVPMLWLTGKSSYHLWYIVMIIPMYLLFPWLRAGIRHITRWIGGRKRVLIGVVLLVTVGYEMMLLLRPNVFSIADMLHIPVLSAYFTTYLDRNVIYFLYYFIFGALAGLHMNLFLQLLQKVKFLIPIICGGFVVYYTSRVMGGFPVDASFSQRFNFLVLLQPWMALFLTALVLLGYQIALQIKRDAAPGHQKFWQIISRYSYGGYLAHALMLRLAYQIDDWLFADMSVILRTLIICSLGLGLSIALTYVLSKVKWGSWFIGIPYRKAR